MLHVLGLGLKQPCKHGVGAVCCRFLYDWAWEPFSVRRKDFWPLDKARSLLDKFIPQLCHESDGLILQVRGSGGVCNVRCYGLLP